MYKDFPRVGILIKQLKMYFLMQNLLVSNISKQNNYTSNFLSVSGSSAKQSQRLHCFRNHMVWLSFPLNQSIKQMKMKVQTWLTRQG